MACKISLLFALSTLSETTMDTKIARAGNEAGAKPDADGSVLRKFQLEGEDGPKEFEEPLSPPSPLTPISPSLQEAMPDVHMHRQLSPLSSDDDADEDAVQGNRMVTSQFIKSVVKEQKNMSELGTKERWQVRVDSCLGSLKTDFLLGMVVIFDLVIMSEDINARGANMPAPAWLELSSGLCLLVYSLEFSLSAFAHGAAMFREKVVMVDALILAVGYMELVLAASQVSAQEIGMLRMLRVIRMMRLLRLARKSPALKELRKLTMMFASCIKTLFWSLVFCFLVLTFWAMAAVELVQPLMSDMANEGIWDGCHELCSTAFSSVMRANLTLFKNIVAGDSWGLLAEPIVVRHPWTSIIFVGSLVSLVLGVLNLVVAVVVDTAAEQRQKDVMNLAEDMDAEQEMDLKFLSKIFQKIDEDGSGELELEELIKGAQEVPEFQSRLRVMDIDEHDLVQLFHMLDSDGGGSISPEEFKHALSRWLYDSKTATRFVKYSVLRLGDEQKNLAEQVQQLKRRNDKQFDRLTKMMKTVVHSHPTHATSSSGSFSFRRNRRADTTMSMASIASMQSMMSGEDAQEDYMSESKESRSESKEISKRHDDSSTLYNGSDLSTENFIAGSTEASGLIKKFNSSPALHSMDSSLSESAKIKSNLSKAAKFAEQCVSDSLQEAFRHYQEAAIAAVDASLRDTAAKVQCLSLHGRRPPVPGQGPSTRQVDALQFQETKFPDFTETSEKVLVRGNTTPVSRPAPESQSRTQLSQSFGPIFSSPAQPSLLIEDVDSLPVMVELLV